jgi:uncharacterized Zn-binding protein involved in type VI secretion
MKKTFLISLLSIAALTTYAQSSENPGVTISKNGAVCKQFPNMPANAYPVWPKGTYTPLEDPSCPPCYEYTSKHGTLRMECPYLQFPAEHSTAGNTDNTELAPVTTARANANENVQYQAQSSYTGNYPVCKQFPNMPANAHPVWPKGDYTPLEAQACPPCYEYKSKKTGIMIMECPYLRFPAERKD